MGFVNFIWKLTKRKILKILKILSKINKISDLARCAGADFAFIFMWLLFIKESVCAILSIKDVILKNATP